MGDGAKASGVNSTALGENAQAAGDNSIALGQGSAANRPNTVSVGNASTGLNRQITNVAPGTGPNDAATFGQLNQGLNQALGKAQQYADTSGALSMAAVNAAAAAAGSDCGPNRVALGVGEYNGQVGFAGAYQHNFTKHWDGNITVSSNGTSANTAVGAGGAYSW